MSFNAPQSTTPNRTQVPAFVEGLDTSAYGITRSLGRHGVFVHALNDSVDGWMRLSRYCRRVHVFQNDDTQARSFVEESVANEDDLCRLLIDAAKEFSGKPVLYATSDWFARMLVHRQRELAPYFLYHWISEDLHTTITDKGRMAAFCKTVGIRIPHTHATQPGDDMWAVARQLPYPSLVKPVHRYTVPFPNARKVFIAESADGLARFFDQHPELKGATLIQELIEGGDDQIFQCTAMVKNSGEVAAHSIVRKLQQYPPHYGSMCRGRTEANEKFAGEALKLLSALDYRGLGSLEFKYSARDDNYYFIEMNTRLPWYNGLFADAGVNLAYLAFADLTGQEASRMNRTQRDNVTWASFPKYSKWFDDSAGERTVNRRQWFQSVLAADSFACWNWQDPAPFVGAAVGRIRALAGGLLRRVGLRK